MLALLPPQRAQGPTDPKLICFAEVTHVTFIHTLGPPRPPVGPQAIGAAASAFPAPPVGLQAIGAAASAFPALPVGPRAIGVATSAFPAPPVGPQAVLVRVGV
jgi:hypothetical protein